MKTYTLIFVLSFISSIAFSQVKGKGGSGGGAAAASYAATGKAIMSSDTAKTSITKQTQGATFGEKVDQGLHAAGSVVASGAAKTENPLYQGNAGSQNNPLHKSEANVASPGNPIGGIIVKGGKNK